MSRTEALSCVRVIQNFYFQLLYQVTEVGLSVMKMLNKFRVMLASLVCSLMTHECLLCGRPCALGTRVGHGAVVNVTAAPAWNPHPAQDRPGWAVGGVPSFRGGCACTAVEAAAVVRGWGVGLSPVP